MRLAALAPALRHPSAATNRSIAQREERRSKTMSEMASVLLSLDPPLPKLSHLSSGVSRLLSATLHLLKQRH